MKTVVLTTVLLAIGFGWAEEAMTEKNEDNGTTPPALVLDPEPLAPDAVLATLDIVSKQGRLGQGDIIERHGQVTIGKPLLYKLEEPTGDMAQLLAPNGQHWRFYLVVFRFTIHPPPGQRRYREMAFKVALSDSRITAFQLLPERVANEEDVNKGFDIGFSISLPVGGDASAKATKTVQFTRLRPVITAFGDGESEFYWLYTAPSDMPVEPGARRTAAVLQVPFETERLIATIRWGIDLERSVFDQWRNIPVSVGDFPLELQLH